MEPRNLRDDVEHTRIAMLQAQREAASLNFTEEKSKFHPMDREVTTKDYIDRSMDAVRAQNDARFAEVLGEIRGLRQDISEKPSVWQMTGVVFAGAATILGVALAALSYGGDRFDGGVGMADQRFEQIQRDAEQDAIIRRLDAPLDTQPTSSTQAPETPTE